jgi:putative flippase GtrA
MAALARRPAVTRLPAPSSTVRQIASFAAIGVASTAAYAILYVALRTVMDPAAANALSLVATAVGNTAANRRITFAVRERAGAVRDQVGGLVALGVALAITTVAVGVLQAVAPDAGRLLELTVLVAANALATVCRFLLLRRWIAGSRRAAESDQRRAAAANQRRVAAANHPGVVA